MTKDQHGPHSCVNLNQSASMGECDNDTAVTPVPGSAVVNLPVTLADIRVTSNLSANIHFPDPVLEIKDIKKRVKIVQCTLLLGGNTVGDDDLLTQGVPLYIKGFIRKNIQYATPCPRTKGDCVASDMRSLTVDVPFDCVTTIDPTDFLALPLIPANNSRSEFDFFRAQDLGRGFPEKDQLLSSDLSQFHQVSTQFYNQFPYCEIVESRIVQWDEAIDRYPLHHGGPFEEGTFRTIVEKALLEFRVRVYQNQPITIALNGNGGL